MRDKRLLSLYEQVTLAERNVPSSVQAFEYVRAAVKVDTTEDNVVDPHRSKTERIRNVVVERIDI